MRPTSWRLEKAIEKTFKVARELIDSLETEAPARDARSKLRGPRRGVSGLSVGSVGASADCVATSSAACAVDLHHEHVRKKGRVDRADLGIDLRERGAVVIRCRRPRTDRQSAKLLALAIGGRPNAVRLRPLSGFGVAFIVRALGERGIPQQAAGGRPRATADIVGRLGLPCVFLQGLLVAAEYEH